MLRVEHAVHAEEEPGASETVISELFCSLAGQEESVWIAPGMKAAAAYAAPSAIERYRCAFGLNPLYRDSLEGAGLRASAIGADGEARILELDRHPFFVSFPGPLEATGAVSAVRGFDTGGGPQGAPLSTSPVCTRHSAA